MRMPVIFSGHGSPMIAIEKNEITAGMETVGKEVTTKYGKPKAILAISAHWYTNGTYTQSEAQPEQRIRSLILRRARKAPMLFQHRNTISH